MAVRERSLAVLVPSRGRPMNMERLIKAMRETCTGDTWLFVGLDADDPTLDDYPLGGDSKHLKVRSHVKENLHQVVAWINYLSVAVADQFPALGTIGDDNIPRTVGWDEKVLRTLEDVPFCYGNDLYPLRPEGSLCTHIFCRSEVVRTLGYMGPPALRHMYVDPVWLLWGQALGIEYLPDLIMEHLHYSSGGAPHDQTYTEADHFMRSDGVAFNAYLRTQLNLDIQKLRGRVYSKEELTKFNRDMNIPE